MAECPAGPPSRRSNRTFASFLAVSVLLLSFIPLQADTPEEDCEDFTFDNIEEVESVPDCSEPEEEAEAEAEPESESEFESEPGSESGSDSEQGFVPGSDTEQEALTETGQDQDTADFVSPDDLELDVSVEDREFDRSAIEDETDRQEDADKGITEKEDESAGWISILPPVIAIVIALTLRQVLLALFLGVWMGAWLVSGASLPAVFTTFFTSVSEYIIPSVADADHVSILVFSLLIGGMVGIIGANGGTRGIVHAITRLITTRRRAQLSTTGLGYAVFFDDYANTMVVGSTMRPLTDQLRISRAKLAYLVDSTAAPVAIIAVISTWIGAVVGYIREAESAIPGFTEAAYLIFLNSLPYNFYAFLAIIFVAVIAYSGRDFGPMRRVEQEAADGRDSSQVKDQEDEKPADAADNGASGRVSHWMNAAIPILGLIIATMAGLWVTGEGDTLQEIAGTSDSYAALVWGSVFSLFLASVLTVSQRLLTIEQMFKGMFRGMHLMFEGLIILVLAWSLGMVTHQLDTAGFLVSLLEGILSPYWVPVIIFILAGVTSFATGSSWGTMGILMPLVLPLTWSLGDTAGLDSAATQTLIYSSVSAVLAGAVWGDHCSPISDTTILSSLACHCDHVTHVNTQLPYALVVGGLSVLAMIASAVIGLPVWMIYPLAMAVMVGIVYRFGKPVRFGEG